MREILGTTCGYPATWNDKTIIVYDDLIRVVHEGKLFDDYELTLFEYNISTNIAEIK